MSDLVDLRPARVEPRPLAEVCDAVPGLALRGSATGVDVTGVTHDSRQVRSGDLFAALPGAHGHGADHVGEVVDAGAVAVLTDADGANRASAHGLPLLVADDPRRALGPVASRVYGDPTAHLALVGVTGTNGKTTTSYLIDAGLRAAGRRTGLIGTVETRIGDAVVPSIRTTPEAPDLQALFAAMVEQGVTAAAMEVSSHALALHRVDGTSFTVAVFTNLSQDHLDFHADLEDYFSAKARLFTPDFGAVGVVDVDDDFGARLAREASVRVVTVSPAGDASAEWWVSDTRATLDGSTFVLHGPDGSNVDVHVPLAGEFNVRNAALAVVALVESGVDVTDAVHGIATCSSVPGRMERIDEGQGFLALVDYAHTPDAVATLLDAVRPLTAGRVLVVLGCGGDRDRGKRPLMGAAAAAGADVAVLTSDNPRTEDPEVILDAVVAGARSVPASSRAEIVVEADRRAAIRAAVDRAGPGDVVVVAGKGPERTQEVAGRLLPFDDVGELRAALTASRGVHR